MSGSKYSEMNYIYKYLHILIRRKVGHIYELAEILEKPKLK